MAELSAMEMQGGPHRNSVDSKQIVMNIKTLIGDPFDENLIKQESFLGKLFKFIVEELDVSKSIKQLRNEIYDRVGILINSEIFDKLSV